MGGAQVADESISQQRRRLSLLGRIGRRYRTSRQAIEVGPIQLDFTRIANPDTVLDEVAAEEDRREKVSGRRHEEPLHLPYWAELWESARAIGQHLLGLAIDSQTRVLDLGCGMGLSGVIAARLGTRVLFADLEPPALLFARLNSLEDQSRVRTRRVDWRVDQLGERFDLILGADILYERKQWEYLDPFWKDHLAGGGAILLGEPGRETGKLFVPWIEQRGWQLDEFAEAVPGRPRPIRIFRLMRDDG